MVIYEVNLAIDGDIYAQFQLWLKEHVKDMLQFPGFIKACILKPENEITLNQEKLTIHYLIKDRASLTVYFNEFASKMRDDGINRFQNKFSAERRIFEIQENILK